MNRCGATPPDNGFGSPHRTHSKSMSWDSHAERLFLSLWFWSAAGWGEHFYDNAPQEFFLPLLLNIKQVYSRFLVIIKIWYTRSIGDVRIKKISSTSPVAASLLLLLWPGSCSFFPSRFKVPAAHSIAAYHIYTFPVYGYSPKVMLLFKSGYISAQIQTLRCLESLCGCYMCHQTEQLTSKDEEKWNVERRTWTQRQKKEK